ncbi:fimbrillin family protein [Parabacteroides sp. OttesenSCG-928-N08]|nr:fimbrillin family protein [Parabacteroides sp. OttesenSCG-928-N08]
MKKSISILIIALLFTSCGNEIDPRENASEPVTFRVETRALTADATITLSVNGTTDTYTLSKDDNSLSGNQLYIAPNTQTLSVYAWGTVEEEGIAMPVSYANPITAVTWDNDGKPAIALTLTPATARVKLSVEDIQGNTISLSEATLHGIATPASPFDWTTTTMPPQLNAAESPNDNQVVLAIDDSYTQIMPGTVPIRAHLLSLTINSREYPIITTRPYTFLAGYDYTINITINNEGGAVINHTTISAFKEGGPIEIGTNPTP